MDILQVTAIQTRFLNLMEYQSKVLMQDHGVNIQKFKLIKSPDEAKTISSDLSKYQLLWKNIALLS